MMTVWEKRRFWSKADLAGPSDCWPWRGASASGYGTITHRQQILQATHVALELYGRKRPEGSFALHRCDNPLCVNPAHLWWGDQSENLRDASRKRRMRGQDQTHCSRGHAYTPENTYRRPNGARDCRTCIRDRAAKYRGKAA